MGEKSSALIEPRRDSHPFQPCEWYKLAQLRRFEGEIMHNRQVDPSLSATMRVQTWAKPWNEELRPLKVFADHKALSDDDEFCWTPDGAADFNIRITTGETIKIQSTMAYPEWEGGVGKQGGHVYKLEMIAFNKDGYSYPGGLVTAPRARSAYDDVEACRRGIIKALQNKLRPEYAGCYLLIFAPRFGFHTIDFDFAQVIAPAIEQVGKAEWEHVFEGLWVCDDYSFFEARRSPEK